MKDIACVVLAAGMSKRMGNRNKLLLNVNGKPLYQHICHALSGNHLKLMVTAFPEIDEYAALHDFTVIWNNEQSLGQSHSIKLALHELKNYGKNIKGVLFATADQPFITTEVIRMLYSKFQLHDCDKIIVPACKDRTGSPCIFPMRYADELLQLTGDKGGRAVYKNHINDVIFAELMSERPLLDIDTPADLDNVEAKYR